MAALLAAAAEPLPDIPFVSFDSEGVIADLRPRRARDRGRQPAQGPSRRHRADQAARRRCAAARHRVSGGARAPSARPRAISAPSSSRSTTTRSRRRRRAARSRSARRANGAVSRCDLILDLSGGAPLFSAADLRDGYLRADPGDPAAVLRAVLKARDLVGTFDKPRYITFNADLCAHSRSQHRRLPPLPRSLPDRRDHARRRSRRDRRAYLRRLRPMRRGLPDRRGVLCAAAGRRADAQAARAAHRPIARPAATQPVVLLHDEAHGAPLIDALARHRRRPAGQRAAARGQRGDAGRPRSHRGGLRLWRDARCACCCARKPRHDVDRPAPDARAGRADPRRARLRRRPRRHDRDRRSGRARRGAARASRRGEPAPRPASFLPVGGKRDVHAAGAARAAARGARAGRRGARCPRARRSARSRSMSRAARSASPACRPARPARSSTIPSGRCCASPRTPACNAGCARRPARRR